MADFITQHYPKQRKLFRIMPGTTIPPHTSYVRFWEDDITFVHGNQEALLVSEEDEGTFWSFVPILAPVPDGIGAILENVVYVDDSTSKHLIRVDNSDSGLWDPEERELVEVDELRYYEIVSHGTEMVVG